MHTTKGFKGFDNKLQCHPCWSTPPFQYEVGGSYKTRGAKICSRGFHFCAHPLETFGYYNPGRGSRYCSVVGDGQVIKGHDKYACTDITVDKEYSLDGVIAEAIRIVEEGLDADSVFYSTRTIVESLNGEHSGAINERPGGVAYVGDDKSMAETKVPRSCAIASHPYSLAKAFSQYNVALAMAKFSVAKIVGDFSVAVALADNSAAQASQSHSTAITAGHGCIAENLGPSSMAAAMYAGSIALTKGFHGVAVTTSNDCIARNEGPEGIAASSGAVTTIINTGDRGVAASSGTMGTEVTNEGNYGVSVATGNCCRVTNKGNGGVALAVGFESNAATEAGEQGMAIAYGPDSVAKGCLGSWLVLTEYNLDGKLLHVKSVKVTGRTIKPDTWYTLVDGKPVPVNREET